MCLRISSAATALLVLASCGPKSAEPQGEQVSCAIGADADFAEVCTLESVAGGGEFVIHHPDGGFRRVEYDRETDEIGVVGGADTLRLSDASTADIAEFAIGADRYRISSLLLRAPAQ